MPVAWEGELAERLGVPVSSMRLLAGGASKEAWAVDAGGRRLLVRRAAGGVIHQYTLSLEEEFRVVEAAYEAGVRVPRAVAYLGELGGREAFATERVEGETIGRRIVKKPPPGLPLQLAEELARIHAIPSERLPFLQARDPLETFRLELDSVGEPHPAIEYGLRWLRERRPQPLPPVVSHGDFRIGNVVVSDRGLEYLLDWEFAHLSDPREDLSWPLVRAWRFGADARRLGGVGQPEPYLERYAELTGRKIALEDLLWWEVLGNAKWAVGALTQSRRHLSGQERSIELAVLGRLAAEMEYELLDLIQRADAPAPAPASPGEARSVIATHDRPTPAELAEATREFLETEILPVLEDPRLRFRTHVAANAVGILQRELEAASEPEKPARVQGSLQGLTPGELAQALRAGEGPADALPVLQAHVEAKLRVASPRYLERYR